MNRTGNRRLSLVSNLRRIPRQFKPVFPKRTTKAPILWHTRQISRQEESKPQSSESRLNTTDMGPAREIVINTLANYSFEKQLGKGSYAVVKLATLKETGVQYAIKTYEKSRIIDPRRKKSVQREIKIIKMLNHEAVPKLIDVIDCPKQLHLVQEYAKGESLHRFVRRQPQRRLKESQ